MKWLAYIAWFVIWFLVYSFVFTPLIKGSGLTLVVFFASFANFLILVLGFVFITRKTSVEVEKPIPGQSLSAVKSTTVVAPRPVAPVDEPLIAEPEPVHQDPAYITATKEIESGMFATGLWARAFVEAEGDDGKQKAIYLRERAGQLAQEAMTPAFPSGSSIAPVEIPRAEPPPEVRTLSNVAAQASAIRHSGAPFEKLDDTSSSRAAAIIPKAGLIQTHANALLFVAGVVVIGLLVSLSLHLFGPAAPGPENPIAQPNNAPVSSPAVSSTTPPNTRESKSSSGPSAPAQPTTAQPPAQPLTLSPREMRECIAEFIRIEAAKRIADAQSTEQMRVINSHLEKYRQACGSNGVPYEFPPVVVASADAYRSMYENEGREWVTKALSNAPLPAKRGKGDSTDRTAPVRTVPPEGRETQPGPNIAGAPPQQTQKTAPQFRNLVHAASMGTAVDVRRMLDEGADVNGREDGTMPLISAVRFGKVEIAELLIARGANVERTDNKGFTAMMWAKQHGDGPMVQLLERAGAINPYGPSGTRAR